MTLITGLLFNFCTPLTSLMRYLGPLPVIDLFLLEIRRALRWTIIFLASILFGGSVILSMAIV